MGQNWYVDAGTSSSNAFYLNVSSTAGTFNWVTAGTDNLSGLIFTRNVSIPNENVRHVPYTGNYRKASDIVKDIEGGIGAGTNTKISSVRYWDRNSQSYIIYRYSSSAGMGGNWVGTDFELRPGTAVNILPSNTATTFTWTPGLVVTPVP
jgi:hypothetical protein